MEQDPPDIHVQYELLKKERPEEWKSLLSDPSRPSVQREAAISLVACSSLSSDEKVLLLRQCLNGADCRLSAAAAFWLGRMKHAEIVPRLREVMRDRDLDVPFEILASLAEQGDVSVYEPCAHLLCHGNAKQRRESVIVLGFLGTEKALSLLEVVWSADDLAPDQRRLIALSLARHGNRLGEAFLEEELPGNDVWRIPIAAALARLDNPKGLQALEDMVTSLSSVEKVVEIQRAIATNIGISDDRDHDRWRAAVLSWIDQRRHLKELKETPKKGPA
jgi:HEAT repeat protein